jgi:hypothetical protein
VTVLLFLVSSGILTSFLTALFISIKKKSRKGNFVSRFFHTFWIRMIKEPIEEWLGHFLNSNVKDVIRKEDKEDHEALIKGQIVILDKVVEIDDRVGNLEENHKGFSSRIERIEDKFF